MLLMKNLISFLIVHLVIASPQINLHLTDQSIDSITVQHDCLHVTTSIEEINVRQINSYCMSEWPSKWNIVNNDLDQIFTFSELYNMNVTSEHLYRWSGSMDVIERYQLYLNQRSTIIGTEIFYNCSSPRFGPQCQYSLDIDESQYLSLNEIIEDYYHQSYEPKTLTCYTHLQCNRGTTTVCLDWSDICDGKIDCIDEMDEKNCFPLMNNTCADDEYRCDNGQCIPKTFVNDGFNNFDCLDRSDEFQNSFKRSEYIHDEPTFHNEDIMCSWRNNLHPLSLSAPLTSSCMPQRQLIIEQAMFANQPVTVHANCLLALKCLYKIPILDNPLCSNFCEFESCKQIIKNMCPDDLYISTGPVAYGHIYLIFTIESALNWKNETLSAPTYICYNEERCGEFPSNKTLITINGLTCRRPEDFPIYFRDVRGLSYLDNINYLFSKLLSCNTITYEQSVICNSPHLYQCQNSSKCIPKLYIGDGIPDCDYKDDEDRTLFDELCLTDQSNLCFKCPTTNHSIRRDQIENGYCDCGMNEYNMCDDENQQLNEFQRTITFSTICDGLVHLHPIMIDGQYETDETNCKQWPCNNTYTRCDGYWNCPNGADEINCDPSPLLNCPANNHICVSLFTNDLMCLPIEKANDGIVDCLGGTDESTVCPLNENDDKEKQFYCTQNGDYSCLSSHYLCNNIRDCDNNDDERFCGTVNNLSPNGPGITDAQKFFYAYFHNTRKSKAVHFFAGESKQNEITLLPQIIKKYEPHCRRGLPLRVWLDTKKNLSTITCLCPPSYYGDQCQYQNQRVSLTMQLNTSSSKRTLFTLVISLVDDSTERIIHSFQQLTYLYMRDENRKFNFYLLYSTRLKDTRKNYSIHIDIYNKFALTYQGSLLIPLKFPFLPVERIAVKFDILQVNHTIPICKNHQCIHGQCIQYINDLKNTSFCRCEPGWTGQYCNISYKCTCSLNSSCVGIDANNRSICVCPLGRFGSQCLLNTNMYQSHLNNRCYNGGICIPDDESCYCLCTKGFRGNKCEIPDTKIILSFHKDIVLSLPSLVSFRFIYLNNYTTPIDDNNSTAICPNDTSIITYWSRPFHIAFIQILEFQLPFYLIRNNHSSIITQTINPLDRCRSLNEIFDENIVQLHLLQRIKYYHLPCQNHSLNLSCFYDEIHMCVCEDDGYQRLANCFKFDHHTKLNDFDIDSNNLARECDLDYPSDSTMLPASITSSDTSTLLNSITVSDKSTSLDSTTVSSDTATLLNSTTSSDTSTSLNSTTSSNTSTSLNSTTVSSDTSTSLNSTTVSSDTSTSLNSTTSSNTSTSLNSTTVSDTSTSLNSTTSSARLVNSGMSSIHAGEYFILLFCLYIHYGH